MVATSALAVVASCGGGGSGPGSCVSRADHFAPGRLDPADLAPATFGSKTNELGTFQLTHSDRSQTPFTMFTFTPRRIVWRNVSLLCDTCTVAATGDASVYTASSPYASALAFLQALGIRHERTLDNWVPGRLRIRTGVALVFTAMEGPGTYLLAAPK